MKNFIKEDSIRGELKSIKRTIQDSDIADDGKLPQDIEGVTEIDASNCTKLIDASQAPEGVVKLNYNGCVNLRTLNIPDSVTSLDLESCSSLEELPELPPQLEFINLIGCDNLSQTIELKEVLLILESQKCKVEFPKTFSFDYFTQEREGRLAEIIRAYKNNKPYMPVPFAITGLISRFLNEGTSERGGVYDIFNSVDILLEFLEKNLDNVEWVEEVAKIYVTDGCVNQPVAGFIEIAALLSIAVEENIRDKIEAATYLMTISKLRSYVAKSQRPVGVLDEVSSLLRRSLSMFCIGKIGDEGKKQIIPNEEKYNTLDENGKTLLKEYLREIYTLLKDQPLRGDKTFLKKAKILLNKAKDALYENNDILGYESLEKVYNGISFFVQRLSRQLIKAGVEVEATNCLIKGVHDKLLEENIIKGPWIGIPNKIRYYGICKIDTWLKGSDAGDIVDIMCTEIKKSVLNKTLEEKASYLCESHHLESWGQIAFPEQVKEIKDRYEEEMENISTSTDYSELIRNRDKEIATKVRELTEISIQIDELVSQVEREPSSTINTEFDNTTNRLSPNTVSNSQETP